MLVKEARLAEGGRGGGATTAFLMPGLRGLPWSTSKVEGGGGGTLFFRAMVAVCVCVQERTLKKREHDLVRVPDDSSLKTLRPPPSPLLLRRRLLPLLPRPHPPPRLRRGRERHRLRLQASHP
jgi:hypothetical protein